ncbi:bifunctional adenosylcobinamide kinase/adenosylcobinamide-phosphate guanylyltransferase [Listeria monocytogenes]|uniref:bifunctional adenosylcobinamide kinase/adenosylcobinamide-phosphate guanylyltransferase n=1 Tax=Listeria monocytogenes TaxID=1639 RepID=UPI0009A4BCCE|nr:bifunctional adenosylcobinamide kinase/adenosylcobinamide-phosphate guanylyltransferase [Listeria monocytogenes]EAG7508648.1 bifunctional adenosylcobinamide kinase/adenosylcobinamide-phosphate guanylyltransferase [Listeria monocytogenes]EDN9486754.1 bifunctional adenosylcobinamide kinase/adenosylcobinamide-phosphate guanylyltransferase [Listeria monocytogenes]EDO0381584.1 bifunctional adenosylcobinamide kinase/adenosylcobinamide-phosphate guanylyltransferase [Listeria monocytogenes]HEM907241
MSEMMLVTGGARSGKSSFAEREAAKYDRVLYVATGIAFEKDTEFQARIKKHQATRPANWDTFEAFQGIASYLDQHSTQYDVMMLDCVTMLVTNLFFTLLGDRELTNEIADEVEAGIQTEVSAILEAGKASQAKLIFVTNEIGLGVVPENKLTRVFRDIIGRVNQQIATQVEEVYLVVSGIPKRWK